MSWSDEQGMRLALAQALQAQAANEVPVGAVVVKDGKVVATGRNAPIASKDPTAHAEVVALREAAKVLGNYRLDGCTLYVTLEPCAMCSGAMLHARVDRVVFGAADPRTGTAGSVLNLFEQHQLNHQTQVLGGVLADECAQVLRDFFKPRRSNPDPLREDALRVEREDLPQIDWPAHWSHFWRDLPSAPGWRVHALWRDEGVAVRTVAIHARETWSAVYRQVVAQDPTLVALDLLGFGLSDKPKKAAQHSAAWHAEVLADCLLRLGGGSDVCFWVPESMAVWWSGVQTHRVSQGHAPWVYSAPKPTALATADWSRPWADAPYPDKGHRLAQNIWPR